MIQSCSLMCRSRGRYGRGYLVLVAVKDLVDQHLALGRRLRLRGQPGFVDRDLADVAVLLEGAVLLVAHVRFPRTRLRSGCRPTRRRASASAGSRCLPGDVGGLERRAGLQPRIGGDVELFRAGRADGQREQRGKERERESGARRRSHAAPNCGPPRRARAAPAMPASLPPIVAPGSGASAISRVCGAAMARLSQAAPTYSTPDSVLALQLRLELGQLGGVDLVGVLGARVAARAHVLGVRRARRRSSPAGGSRSA